MNDIRERVEEISKKLDGKIGCWQDNELYWCLSTIIKQNEKLQMVEYEIDNSDMGTAVDNIIKIIKG